MRRAIKRATATQQDYQDRARALGCVVCRFRQAQGLQAEDDFCGPTHIHHRNVGDYHGQKQLGQDAVVALGAWHHDGVTVMFWSDDDMRERYGPSFKFAADFREYTMDALPDLPGKGTERWQAFQDQLLGEIE